MKEWMTCNVDKLVKVWEKLGRDLYAVDCSDSYCDFSWEEFHALPDCDKEGVWALCDVKCGYYIPVADVRTLKNI